MDTVFTIATHEELLHLFDNEALLALEREAKHTPDEIHAMLASLYYLRGDMKKRDACLAKIQDDQYRFDSTLLFHERVQ